MLKLMVALPEDTSLSSELSLVDSSARRRSTYNLLNAIHNLQSTAVRMNILNLVR